MLPDLLSLIVASGYVGSTLVVFAESGLFFGFFLPGDSLLVTLGLLASQGHFNIWILLIALTLAAIIGDSVGYWFGSFVGPKLYKKKDSRVFKQSHLRRARRFYKKHGGKAIVLARFVPIVRTFAPIVAGVAGMEYRRFLFFNILGAMAWVIGMLMLGYTIGNTVPNAERYTPLIIAIIVAVSLLPLVLERLKSGRV